MYDLLLLRYILTFILLYVKYHWLVTKWPKINFKFDYCSDFEDEEFENLVLSIEFPGRQRIFKPWTDYFTWWREVEFFNGFYSSKDTIRSIVNLLYCNICNLRFTYFQLKLLFG